jgi:hypothetical protein
MSPSEASKTPFVIPRLFKAAIMSRSTLFSISDIFISFGNLASLMLLRRLTLSIFIVICDQPVAFHYTGSHWFACGDPAAYASGPHSGDSASTAYKALPSLQFILPSLLLFDSLRLSRISSSLFSRSSRNFLFFMFCLTSKRKLEPSYPKLECPHTVPILVVNDVHH